VSEYVSNIAHSQLQDTPLAQWRKRWLNPRGLTYYAIVVPQQLTEITTDNWVVWKSLGDWPAMSPDLITIDFIYIPTCITLFISANKEILIY
jgi:hypothetical protein